MKKIIPIAILIFATNGALASSPFGINKGTNINSLDGMYSKAGT